MRRNRKGGAIIEAIIILTGLALMAKSFTTATATYKLMNISEPTDGVIISLDHAGFTLVVQFTSDKGSGIVFSQTGFFFARGTGEHVPVRYDRDEPTRALIDDGRALWFKPATLMLCAIILLGSGFRLRATRNL